MNIAPPTDAELVGETLSGNRDAFAQIVTRYQSLVCALAYSATGNLGQSEDLAQETFITAWKHLAHLRERSKLRSWLGGIARNRINDFLRREGCQPLHQATTLENLSQSSSPEPLPSEQAISQEEAALLWRALERIPEAYRETLVLYYRENQSVQSVAHVLELSEDAVHQRLSRGRKLLQEQVLAFVKGALERTKPGRAFTFGVLAALPVLGTSAKAAAIGMAAAKGSATATGATLVSVLSALFGPVIGILGGWFGVRAGLDATRTPRERQYVMRQMKMLIATAIGFNAVLVAFILSATNTWSKHPILFAALGGAFPILFAGFILSSALRYNRQFRRIREEERRRHPEAFQNAPSVTMNRLFEYRSRWTLFGLPLIHVRSGARLGEKIRPAVGWIALGDLAYGILFAAGGISVGAVSMGGAAVGLLSIGGAAVGLLTIGGFALGGLAIGGGAIGLMAAGGLATGWVGAEGGLAIAREFALGGQALAHHANDDAARAFFGQYPWLDLSNARNRNWFLILCWSPMLMFVWQFFRYRKQRQK